MFAFQGCKTAADMCPITREGFLSKRVRVKNPSTTTRVDKYIFCKLAYGGVNKPWADSRLNYHPERLSYPQPLALFCSVLFCSVLFCSVLFCSVLFYPILFYPVLFYPILFYPILFCVLFCFNKIIN